MTTPKFPARPGPSLKPDSAALHDTINELEVLITDKASVPQDNTGNTDIPILDEIIEPEDTNYIDDMEMLLHQEKLTEPPTQQEHISHEQLEKIISNVEGKLAGELDALVNILKDSIKDSIMSEIKTQLESSLNKTRTENPDDKQT
jgi:hypothetical protein